MSIDDKVEVQITKAEFDNQYKSLLTGTEELIKTNTAYLLQAYQSMDVDQIVKYSDNSAVLHSDYLYLIEFRQEYRASVKTHRVKHTLTNGILDYVVQEQRRIGFKIGENK